MFVLQDVKVDVMGRAAKSHPQQAHQHPAAERRSGPAADPALADKRRVAIAHRKLVKEIHDSAHVVAQRKLADAIGNSPNVIARSRQLQGAFGAAAQSLACKASRHARPVLQGAADGTSAHLQSESPAPNRTGLPDDLKAGIERLSGLAMDDVQVHYRSPKPAQRQALAYTQGMEIHVGPGQEPHLPHEAWHVVQQKQGRVKSTMQMDDGVPVNDDMGLEREADAMGSKALASPAQVRRSPGKQKIVQPGGVVQRFIYEGHDQLQNKKGLIHRANAILKRMSEAHPLPPERQGQIIKKFEEWLQDNRYRRFPNLEHALAEIRDQVNQPNRASPLASAQSPQMNSEELTHIGFEMEGAVVIHFPLSALGTLNGIVNKTLAECRIDGSPILELILDDIKNTETEATAQVEFRTPKLKFSRINPDLGENIRAALRLFPRDMLNRQESVAGKKGDATIRWEPTRLLTGSEDLKGAQSEISFPASARLAQHATTSIELQAFSTLNEQQQGLLFPQAAGARSKQAVLSKLASITRGHPITGLIDASTMGRNVASPTVKTPIESILAADPSLTLPAVGKGSVTVGAGTNYPLHDVSETVNAIRGSNYPSIQGEGGTGYRAIAEKLQAPLRDKVSGEVRVLIEDRVQHHERLVYAVNQALNGKPDLLKQIANAARAMDDARIPRQQQSSEPSTAARREERPTRTQGPQLMERPRPGTLVPGPSPTVSAAGGDVDAQRRGQQLFLERPHGARNEERSADTGTVESSPMKQTGRPFIAPPAEEQGLRILCKHYAEGVSWAEQQGTFSAMFRVFQDDLGKAMALLKQNGLGKQTALSIEKAIREEMTKRNVLPGGRYVKSVYQEQIFDAVDPVYGRHLWALLRYFSAPAPAQNVPSEGGIGRIA